jgi:hypothetical protein
MLARVHVRQNVGCVRVCARVLFLTIICCFLYGYFHSAQNVVQNQYVTTRVHLPGHVDDSVKTFTFNFAPTRPLGWALRWFRSQSK